MTRRDSGKSRCSFRVPRFSLQTQGLRGQTRNEKRILLHTIITSTKMGWIEQISRVILQVEREVPRMNTSHSRQPFIPVLFAALAVMALSSMAFAQLGRIGDAVKKHAPNGSSILEGKPPITTSLSDARYGVDSTEGKTPSRAQPLMSLQRTLKGGFVLRPGYYEMQTQSYCLKAGTHGPGGGDGYLYAPPLGPAEEAVVSIVRNSVAHSEIPQHEIQLLL